MHELKLRAWLIEEKKMVKVATLELPSTESNIPYFWGFYYDEKGELKQLNGGKFILLQYTGLNDKNGEEIYDGHITRKYNFSRPPNDIKIPKGRLVHWDKMGCGWNITRPSRKPSHEYEIIGNKFENPELLKEI